MKWETWDVMEGDIRGGSTGETTNEKHYENKNNWRRLIRNSQPDYEKKAGEKDILEVVCLLKKLSKTNNFL